METREVADYPGYFVSSCGNVIGKRGNILKGKTTWDGYKEVVLSDCGRRRSVRVHRLVMECFVGECPDGLQVNHKDGNKFNNHIDNLEYVTNVENSHHAYRTGLHKTNTLTKLSYIDFHRMLEMYNSGFYYSEICEYFDLDVRNDYLGEVLSGRKLKSLTGFEEDMRIKGKTQSKKYSNDVIDQIKQMRREGSSYEEIKSIIGMSIAQISRILNGKRRVADG